MSVTTRLAFACRSTTLVSAGYYPAKVQTSPRDESSQRREPRPRGRCSLPPVYLDYNATTPMDPRVFEAMRPWFLQPSNAGSRTHWYGQQAKQAVDAARAEIAKLLGSQPEEVIFTSGATESNNL